jgi:hypothetical protein
MARMIPSTIHPSVCSAAEKKLFTIFRDATGTDDWMCLHSLGLARHATKRRGEIDFLLITRSGIFVLEVKGGRVSRDNGIWKFIDRYGVSHDKSEGPFDQAAGAMFALEDDIRHHFSCDRLRTGILYGFGVMLPDVVFDANGTEGDPRQIYDARDRRKPIADFIARLAAYWKERDPRERCALNDADIAAIVDYLRGDFDLVPSLGVLLDAATDKLLLLEKEQYAVLDAVEQFPKPRILVQGGAGTGKTLLAIEAAKRAVRKSEGDVLLLCYNRLLATYLQAKVASENQHSNRITVKSIYSLLNDLIESSSIINEFNFKRQQAEPTVVYRDIVPEYAALALMDKEIKPFKTLIIDEAQDMMTEKILDILELYIEGGFEAGKWLVFSDVNNQAAVFGAFDNTALIRLMKFGHMLLLPTNRRNTKQVADETAMLARPKVKVPATIVGVPVKYSWYSEQHDQPVVLRRILKRLLADEVAPNSITVLSPRRIEQCCASSITDPSLITVTSQNVCNITNRSFNAISYCSVSAFKGLENDFIVLTDIDDLQTDWWRSVIYVGMSRARVGLHLLLNESLRPVYELYLRCWLEEHSSKPE